MDPGPQIHRKPTSGFFKEEAQLHAKYFYHKDDRSLHQLGQMKKLMLFHFDGQLVKTGFDRFGLSFTGPSLFEPDHHRTV